VIHAPRRPGQRGLDSPEQKGIRVVEIRGIPEPVGWKDPLTGLDGPDAWQRTLVAEVARSARYGRPLTIVVLEVEGVMELGEEQGEDAGRQVLREAAQALHRESRTSDLVFRIGVTRLGVVLTETDEVAAVNYVERVRESVVPRLPVLGSALRLSFGWASPISGESADVLVRRADHRMIEELLR
jgi:diguanylate cyclase (GGDEF)-like protein